VPRSPTAILVRDEFIGFAKSKVMIVLWIVVPVVALIAFSLIPAEVIGGGLDGKQKLSAATFMSLLMGSIAGLFAGIIPAADIVNEKNRNVYMVFAVRPFPRGLLLWAKFIAVCGCITITCVLSLALGMGLDAVRGHEITVDVLDDALRSMVMMVEVIAMSAALGVVFGVMARSVVVSVLLFIFAGRNLLIVPMLPIYMKVLPMSHWIIMAISTALTAMLMFLAVWMFRRAQL
jgi:ABC-2 type transport system permease protein